MDMEDKRDVSIEEGQQLAKQFDVPFFETSALNGHNISTCFQTIAKDILEKMQS